MKVRKRASEPAPGPRPLLEDRRWLAAVVAALTTLAYLNAAPHALVYDDNTVIAQNPLLTGAARIPAMFGETAREGLSGQRRLYRPVAMASLALDRSVYGEHLRGYHVTSIALHVATVVLLFALLCALGASAVGAALAALLFGVHPVHAEAVDVAFNRSEILACLGVLGALWWVWRWVDRDRRIAWGGVAGLFLLALLSRESAVSLPVVVVLALLLLRPDALEGRRGWALPLTAFALPFAIYVLMRQAAVGEPGGGILRSVGAEGIGGARAPLHRLGVVAATVRDYWRMIVWPWPLRASYEDYVVRGVGAAVALHAVLIGVALACRRRRPALSLGIAFFYVALLPSTRLLADPALLAERFVYLPSAGLAIPLALGLTALARRLGPAPVAGVGLAVAAVLASLTLTRNADWHSREALWDAEYRTGPNDWKVLVNVAQVRLSQRRYEDAIALCDRGIAIAPAQPAFHTNRGLALLALGRTAEAEKSLAEAVRQGGGPGAYANLARLYLATGHLPEAEIAYRDAITHESDPASRHALDGERLYYCRNDTAAARQAFQAALVLSPGLPAAHSGLRLLQGQASWP